jgi:fido (protein-threonine AMPylation protein)
MFWMKGSFAGSIGACSTMSGDGRGQYRTTERTNLGIESYHIQTELRQIIDDAGYWIDHQSYPPDELAVRFHHRLVSVHPFPNGNGRWSRLVADVLIVKQGGSRFT